MSPLLLNLLKLAFVAALYLFLWMVVRAIRVHLAPGGAATAERSGPHVVYVTAPVEAAGQVIAVERPTMIGRSPGADVHLEDPFISERHVRFDRMENRIVVEDLGSTNGTTINGLPLTGRKVLDRGDVIRIGQTMMEIR